MRPLRSAAAVRCAPSADRRRPVRLLPLRRRRPLHRPPLRRHRPVPLLLRPLPHRLPRQRAPTRARSQSDDAQKRRPASPLQSPDAKRSAEIGLTAENPMLVESPEKPAAEPQNRFSAFEFDEAHTSRSPSPALVIAESEPNAESIANEAAEPASRRPTPRPQPVEEPSPDSPRSPSPSPPAASASSREVEFRVQSAYYEFCVTNSDALPGVRRR